MKNNFFNHLYLKNINLTKIQNKLKQCYIKNNTK